MDKARKARERAIGNARAVARGGRRVVADAPARGTNRVPAAGAAGGVGGGMGQASPAAPANWTGMLAWRP
jgi:hypothetical protein